ncbi:MAG TPA: hypothetical protein VNJ08_09290 [Bacteriovoracaceae bacterium]|nr:hypothetical protein [Bacteriovoracaceae bacterium]
MKLIILFIFSTFPLVHADAPSAACNDLVEITKHYEHKLQWQSLIDENESGEKKPDGFCTPDSAEKAVKKTHPTMTEGQLTAVKEYGCDSLAAIELNIAKFENEQSLLMGFHKLKTDIAKNKDDVVKHQKLSGDPKKAKRAGLNFVDGLNAAESLEVLLESADGNMLKVLKSLPGGDRNSVAKVKTAIASICKNDNNTTTGVCKKDAFKPNETALAAINELIDDSDLNNKKTIQNWRNAFAIKRADGKDDDYSFKKMSAELSTKIGDIKSGKLSLNQKQLSAISKLPDFASKLGFTGMKIDSKPFELMQEYKFHVQDLQKRQQFETQSKVVLAYANVKTVDGFIKNLSAEETAACNGAKLDYSKAKFCSDAFQKHILKLPPKNKSLIGELNTAVRITDNHLKYLEATHNSCLIEVNIESPACIEALKNTDGRLGVVSSEILVLHALKAEIQRQNANELKIRDLALARASQQAGCLDHQKSNLECKLDDVKISQTAEVLYSHVTDLMVVNKVTLDIDDKWLCADKEMKAFKKEALCAVGIPKPPVVAKKPEAKEFQAPIHAPSGGHSSPARDAALNGIGQLGGTIIGSLFARQPTAPGYYGPQFNPYPYNYAPYNYGYPLMGISDELLFNARYYNGYGGYSPAAGISPYTAYPTSGARSKSAFFTGR